MGLRTFMEVDGMLRRNTSSRIRKKRHVGMCARKCIQIPQHPGEDVLRGERKIIPQRGVAGNGKDDLGVDIGKQRTQSQMLINKRPRSLNRVLSWNLLK